MRLLGTVAVLATLLGGASGAATLTSGYDTDFANESVALRFRSFQPTGGEEVYLGTQDLGNAGNRLAADEFDWASGGSAFDFSFNFDSNANTLGYQLDGTSAAVGANATYAPDPTINAFKLSVIDRDSTGDIWLTNLVVNGSSLGDVTSASDEGWLDFMIRDVDVSSGMFAVSGTINRTGTFGGSQEASRIELVAGTLPMSAVPVPAALPLMLAGFGALGIVARRNRKAA